MNHKSLSQSSTVLPRQQRRILAERFRIRFIKRFECGSEKRTVVISDADPYPRLKKTPYPDHLLGLHIVSRQQRHILIEIVSGPDFLGWNSDLDHYTFSKKILSWSNMFSREKNLIRIILAFFGLNSVPATKMNLNQRFRTRSPFFEARIRIHICFRKQILSWSYQLHLPFYSVPATKKDFNLKGSYPVSYRKLQPGTKSQNLTKSQPDYKPFWAFYSVPATKKVVNQKVSDPDPFI